MTSSTDTLLAGRYRLGRTLGAGGMAEVHEAVDERLGRPVAVKVLRPAFAAEPGMRRRFDDEARSAARLSHPAVVAVYDSGEDAGRPFIVMERLPGETLADRMAAGAVDVAWLRRMAVDVLGALEAAHAAGVVHRDVKPANILITAEGRAKVGDFGIAKAVQDAPVDLTAANQLVGTPAYLAPERLDGQPATPRSDLYALGVVLYEALAGVKAFPGTTPISVAYAVHHAELTPLAELRPDLDADLVGVVERAMARDARRRFATAAEMAAALEGASPAPFDSDATVAGPVPGAVSAGAGRSTPAADDTAEVRLLSTAATAAGDGTVVLPLAGPAPGATVVDGRAAPEGAAGGATRWPGLLPAATRRMAGRRALAAAVVAGLVLAAVVSAVAAGPEPAPASASDTPATTTPAPVTTAVPEPTTTVAPAAAHHEDHGPAAGKGKKKGRGRGRG